MPNPEIRIGIKYCGGCNPAYDRVAAVNRIKETLKDRVEFLPADEKHLDLILAVQGCPTACADLSAFSGMAVRTLGGPEDVDALIKLPA